MRLLLSKKASQNDLANPFKNKSEQQVAQTPSVMKIYQGMKTLTKEKDFLVERSASGEVLDNSQSRKQIKLDLGAMQSAKKIAEYDEKLARARGRSEERKKISIIAEELVSQTKNQKNRSNMVQLLRNGSLSVGKAVNQVRPLVSSQAKSDQAPKEFNKAGLKKSRV